MKKRSSVFPVIAISGLPRAGSMWTFNVARALVREAGLKLVPDKVPKTDEDMVAIAKSYLESGSTDTRCVIKVHSIVDVSRKMKVIRNNRELRDRLFSFYRFMQAGIEEKQILDEVAWSFNVDSQYDQWPAKSILNIPFDSIQADGVELMCRIAEFTGLPTPDRQTLKKLDFQFSKQQVRKRIDEADGLVFDDQGKIKQNAHPDSLIDVGFGRIRVFDVNSGFQSGHVSDYQPGDWQHLWTDQQKEMVGDAIRIVQHTRGTQKWPRKIGRLYKWIRSMI